MNSAISPDDSTKPDDSKTLLFVPDAPCRFGGAGRWGVGAGTSCHMVVRCASSPCITTEVLIPTELTALLLGHCRD